MNFYKMFILIFVFLVSLFNTNYARDIGFTQDPLRISIGTRAMGMGGAYTAVSDGFNNFFNNPAGLATDKKISFTSMAASLLGDVSYLLFGANIPLGGAYLGQGLGLGFVSSGVDQIATTTQNGLDYFNYRDNVLGLSYGRRMSGRFSDLLAGLRLKLFYEGFSGSQNYAGTGFDMDCGFIYEREGMTAGLLLQNFLPSYLGGRVAWPNGDTEGIPMITRLGFATNHFFSGAIIAADYELSNDSAYQPRLHLGVEGSPFRWSMVKLRGGIDQSYAGGSSYLNPTFGLGLYFSPIVFDYTYHTYFNDQGATTNYFSISYNLDFKKKNKIETQVFYPENKRGEIPSDEKLDMIVYVDGLLRDSPAIITGETVGAGIVDVFANGEKCRFNGKDFSCRISLDYGENKVLFSGRDFKGKEIVSREVSVTRIK